MANNLIYPFGENASGNNILTDSSYQSDNQRLIGNQPGIARQELVNKALRSNSIVAASLAQFIANNQSNNVHDSLTPATLAGMIDAALNNVVGIGAQTITSTTTLTDFDAGLIEADASGGSITITLPSANKGGLAFRIARTDTSTNTVTISAASTENIEGATSVSLTSSDRLTLVADGGTSWRFTGQAQLRNIIQYTSSGTYTPSNGLRYAVVTVKSGGGGGGGAWGNSSSYYAASGGGGEGAQAVSIVPAATIGSSQAVTIGSGGNGGNANTPTNGGKGGKSSFGSIVIADGGYGAVSITGNHVSTSGANGGHSSTGDSVYFGVPGSYGVATSSSATFGGNGGGAGGAAGPGLTSSGTSVVGQNAFANSGGGGSGAAAYQTSENGGNGASGYVEIREYF